MTTVGTTTVLVRHNLTAPVVGVPADTTTPDVELHAARILAAMQRFQDTTWTTAREIRSNRVRSTWANRATVLAALDHLIACGLVEEGKNVDQFRVIRMRYRLTPAGTRAYIHPTRVARTRKRVHVAFDEALAAAEAACPPGYILCMIPVDTAKILSLSRIPVPTEPPMF